MNIPDAYKHPLFSQVHDRQTNYRTRNILCCAIRDMSGKCIAVLQVMDPLGWKEGWLPRRQPRLIGLLLLN